MKDYSRSLEGRREFILSYKEDKKNGKIILYLANGESYPIPYTEENLKKVDSRQKAQVKNENYESRVKFVSKFKKIFYLFQLVPLVFVIAGIIDGIIMSSFIDSILAGGMMAVLCEIGICSGSIGMVFEKSTLLDLEKSMFFLENEEEINANLNKPNILLNVSRKTVAKIEEVKASGKPFNINDVDKLSLKDLKQLKANIDRIMSFGFDEGTATVGQGHQKTYGINEEYK